ncbi:MAG: glycerophosphodiester phosphodiesterase [Chloroflexi bacterium]|jgi:glycerophosphoryl diester phosphodiesterase|nr:glycerophosphodiester phosphodiesterase [Chloroflexota bacterium]
MFEKLPTPTIFAHRGASAHAPENTLAAFELAVRQFADAIELDAKLSADGEVIVFHDQTLERTTDGSGWIHEHSLAALKELDAGCSFDVTFCEERIPTLAEVFESVGQKTYINIELTNYRSPRDTLPEKVVALIEQYGLTERVFFSSFNPIALRQAHKLLPQVPLGLLALSGIGGAWARSALGRSIPYRALHPALSDVTPRLIHKQHQHGCRVHAYTVNHPEDMARLFAWQIDGIFTDDPLLARGILEKLPNPEAAA